MMRAIVLAIGLLIGFAIGLATARADTPKHPLDPATRAKASNLVKQADEFLKTSQWDKAIAEYQAALDLTGEPVLIFDIALANDKGGRPEAALDGYRRYVASAPSGSVADEAREDIARLTPIVDEIVARRRRDEAARIAEEERTAEAARRAEQQRLAEERSRRSSAAQRERADAVDATARRYRWGAIAVGAAGLVGLAAGAKFGLDARAAAHDISAHDGPWTDLALERDADGRAAQTRMIAATALGGAALVGSGVLYLLSRRSHARAERLRLEVGVPVAIVLTRSF